MSAKDIFKAISPKPISMFKNRLNDVDWTRFRLLSPDMRQTLFSGSDEEVRQLLADLETRKRIQGVDVIPSAEFIDEMRAGKSQQSSS